MILNDNRTFFAFDLPGHGLSYHTKGIYYDFFLDGFTSLHKILKHFQWDKATLLGHSLGAVISFMFSATYPE
jgi:pimeloyl-ACP methyl ester carboxylesterase